MGVLARVATTVAIAALAALGALVALAAPVGCYAPSLRDCTVSCEATSDCASGQVCGDDGLCAVPEVAGRCATIEVDAGTTVDAGADAAPDGPPLVTLVVQIDGKGSVDVAGRGVCSSEIQRGRCMYDIPFGVAQRVEAIAIDNRQPFVGWTSLACAGQGAVCTVVPLTATTVVPKFHGER
jgi:hypothetical protein